jgi:hypothetical protein
MLVEDSLLFSAIEWSAKFCGVVIHLLLDILGEFIDNVVLLCLGQIMWQVRSDGVHVAFEYVHDGFSP